MRFIAPHLVNRVGLAFVFFYPGIASFIDPQTWGSYLPDFVSALMPLELALWLHAALEIALGCAILFEFLPRITYAVAALMLIGILVFLGVNDVTFRDVGLALLAVSLWLTATKNERQNIKGVQEE